MDYILDLLIYNENRPLLFTQAFFWVFFGFVVLGYLAVYGKNAWRNAFLLVVSLYFYYLSSGYYFTLLIFSTIVDYYIGNRIYQLEDKSKRKKWVTLSLIINLSVLGYFKYTYFFTDTFNQMAGTDFQPINFLALLPNMLGADMDIRKIFLPIGISFYTFQTISYSIDIYRGKLKPVKNIWDFAFFVSFFPQLVAGPIVRAADFIPQIYQPYRLKEKEFNRALWLIIVGLIKKIIISDYLSINFVDRVYESPTSYSGFENLMATYGYAMQIYCDFSGYTDIAIGIALLLGYRLPLNFNSPYKAESITDFWRRWHISLSSWLRDYLYISLGGNRKGNARTYVNLMLTMLLGGLWHGNHMRFIIWGGIHGIALALHKAWLELVGKSDVQESWAYRFVAGALTFHLVCFCWIFFRANDMDIAMQVIKQITTAFHLELIPDMLSGYAKVFGIMALGYAFHFIPDEWKQGASSLFATLPDLAKATALIFLSLILFQAKSSEVQPFIYFQF